jgi:hypothetical protein
MASKNLITLLLVFNSSCGLLGIYSADTNYDPEFQANALAEINRSEIALKMDSLVRKLDSATLTIPEDLNSTTLVVETYQYEDFLKIMQHKFSSLADTKRHRRMFEKYSKFKNDIIEKPKYKIIYATKAEYVRLDLINYRYVLISSNRLYYNPDNVYVNNAGSVYPWSAKAIYYIYDRQTGTIYKDMEDLSVLSLE